MKKFIKTHINTLMTAIRDDEFTATQTVIMTIGTFIVAAICIGIGCALLNHIHN